MDLCFLRRLGVLTRIRRANRGNLLGREIGAVVHCFLARVEAEGVLAKRHLLTYILPISFYYAQSCTSRN